MKHKTRSFFFVVATVLIVTFVFLLLMFDINEEKKTPVYFSYDSDTRVFEFLASPSYSISNVSISGDKMILLDTPSKYCVKIIDMTDGEIEAVTVFYTGSDEIEHSNEFQITLSNMQFFNIIQQDETGHRIVSYHFIPC